MIIQLSDHMKINPKAKVVDLQCFIGNKKLKRINKQRTASTNFAPAFGGDAA